MKVHYFIVCCLVFFTTTDLFAQRITIAEYIDMWKDLAISEMQRSGIPASIKLAQGILESGFGNSRLAVEGNNHFGIKCHDWQGERIFHDDDEQGECFRKYGNARESWIDHTEFLMTRSRYAFLFEYSPTDYRRWARGLSRAGYATNPNYPQLLINLIERYHLYQFDTGVSASRRSTSRRTPGSNVRQVTDGLTFSIEQFPVQTNNRTEFITARAGDTFASLSDELDMMPWQLPRYNDARATDRLQEGQPVYIQPKRRRAERGNETHTVLAGETMYSISQTYAIRLSRLYTLNHMEAGTQPRVGEVLNLRWRRRN